MDPENDDSFDGEGGDSALTGEINAMLLQVEQLETGASDDSKKPAEQPPAAPPASASPEPSATPTPPQGASQEGVEKPDGDLPQGKVKMVPHGALHEERERRRQLELHTKKLEEELAALRASASGDTGATGHEQTATDVEMMSEEDLQALEAEAPVIAKGIRAQQRTIAEMREQLNRASAVIAKVSEEQTNKVRTQVQAAIEATPEVAYAAALREQGDTEAWDRMTEIDRELKASSYWRSVPTAERLAKVAREYADRYGEIELPPEFAAKRAKTTTAEPTVDEVADAKVKAAKAKAAAAPKTLSDLPAGILPDGDRNQGLKALSVRAMHNRMQDMDVDKINDLISTL